MARKDFGISEFLTDGRYSRVWPEPLDHVDSLPCLSKLQTKIPDGLIRVYGCTGLREPEQEHEVMFGDSEVVEALPGSYSGFRGYAGFRVPGDWSRFRGSLQLCVWEYGFWGVRGIV